MWAKLNNPTALYSVILLLLLNCFLSGKYLHYRTHDKAANVPISEPITHNFALASYFAQLSHSKIYPLCVKHRTFMVLWFYILNGFTVLIFILNLTPHAQLIIIIIDIDYL